MQHAIDIPEEFLMRADCLNNRPVLAARVEAVPDQVTRTALAKVLRYLYLAEGEPVPGELTSVLNMDTKSRQAAEPYLNAGEIIMSRYLATRTNGSGRRDYGKPALHRMRQAGYRCEDCGSPDARTLVLDHTVGRKVDPTQLRVLCANCHQIKSRLHDWLGAARVIASEKTL